MATPIIVFLLVVFGVFFLILGIQQLRSGVAYTRFGGIWGPITRDGAPLFYWSTVVGSFAFGVVMLLIAVSMVFK